MRESKELEIPVTDVDYDTFYLMLQYLYTGKLAFKYKDDKEKKQEQVTQLYKAMHQYLLFDENPALEKFCLERLSIDKLMAKLTEYAKK